MQKFVDQELGSCFRGEGVLPYISHLVRYVPHGMHFAHFGLESGMVFDGTTGVYERIYRFNSK